MNLRQGIVLLVLAGLLFYFGTTMYYETGLGVTDLSVNRTDNSNGSDFVLSYYLRSVRSFDYLDCEYVLLGEDGSRLATGRTVLNDVKDGSFKLNETLKGVDDSTAKEPDRVGIKVYTEKFNPDLKNSDGSYAQKPFFEYEEIV